MKPASKAIVERGIPAKTHSREAETLDFQKPRQVSPVFTLGKAHIEKITEDNYLVIINTNRQSHFELKAFSKYEATQVLRDFCALNNIHLEHQISVPA